MEKSNCYRLMQTHVYPLDTDLCLGFVNCSFFTSLLIVKYSLVHITHCYHALINALRPMRTFTAPPGRLMMSQVSH